MKTRRNKLSHAKPKSPTVVALVGAFRLFELPQELIQDIGLLSIIDHHDFYAVCLTSRRCQGLALTQVLRLVNIIKKIVDHSQTFVLPISLRRLLQAGMRLIEQRSQDLIKQKILRPTSVTFQVAYRKCSPSSTPDLQLGSINMPIRFLVRML